MATHTISRSWSRERPLTFEDMKGLRAEAYIRDSTLDQRDGFGPDIQCRDIKRFADSNRLLFRRSLVHRVRLRS